MSEEQYKTIVDARSALANMKESAISDKTADGYRREYRRLSGVGKTFHGMLTAAKDTQVASTWYRRRASILHGIREELTKTLSEQDHLQRVFKSSNDQADYVKWQKKVARMAPFIKMLPAVLEVKNFPPASERKRRESKKRSLAGLPNDWRECLAKRLPSYRAEFLVAAATGCRPAELVNGVSLSYDTDSKGKVSIKAEIAGAKVRQLSGQPARSIFIELDDKPESIAGQIQEILRAGPVKVQLTKGEKLFSGAVRDAARREWPKKKTDLSAYSLRHQFAADMKGSGWKDEDIAKAMGHITTKTASYYGTKSQARGGVNLHGVEAAREIKVKIKKGIK